jgi:hypothetical protein
MKMAFYPPDSSDLAPSDFYLFGNVKRNLAGLSFESADELLEAVRAALDGIGKGTSQALFLEWIYRLSKCIATNGEFTD